MIFKDTNVLLLDVWTGESHYGSIESAVVKYMRFSSFNQATHTVTISNPALKITDWTGWTDVIEIVKTNKSPELRWFWLNAGGNAVLISEDEWLPVYEPEPHTGFHGEVKYQYTLQQARDLIDKKFTMRILNDEQIFHVSHITPIKVDPEVNFGYIIRTRSGFYNADEAHFSSVMEPKSGLK